MIERRTNERRKRERDDLMTDSEVARMAKVPVRTVRYWRNSGMLTFVKLAASKDLAFRFSESVS